MQFRTCRIEFWRPRRAAERGTLVIFTVARNRAVEFSISRLDGATTDGKNSARTAASRRADEPADSESLRSKLVVAGRESGRVNIGAVV